MPRPRRVPSPRPCAPPIRCRSRPAPRWRCACSSRRWRAGGARACSTCRRTGSRTGTASKAARSPAGSARTPPGRPRVLLAHGWAGDAQQMRALGEAVAAAGLRPGAAGSAGARRQRRRTRHAAAVGARFVLCFGRAGAVVRRGRAFARRAGGHARGGARLDRRAPGVDRAVAAAGAVPALVRRRPGPDRSPGRAHGAGHPAPRRGRASSSSGPIGWARACRCQRWCCTTATTAPRRWPRPRAGRRDARRARCR